MGCYVPYEVVEKCLEIIGKYDFSGWKDRDDLINKDGAGLVCKYLENGETVRVSSDKMPENDEMQMRELKETVHEYKDEKYRIEE